MIVVNSGKFGQASLKSNIQATTLKSSMPNKFTIKRGNGNFTVPNVLKDVPHHLKREDLNIAEGGVIWAIRMPSEFGVHDEQKLWIHHIGCAQGYQATVCE